MEEFSDYRLELMSDRAVLRDRLAAAAIRLCQATEEYNQIIVDILALNESERQSRL